MTISSVMTAASAPPPARIRVRVETRRGRLSARPSKSEGDWLAGEAGTFNRMLVAGPGSAWFRGSAVGSAVVRWSGSVPAGAFVDAAPASAVRTSVRVLSSTFSSRLVSKSNRAGLSSRAWRRTSFARLGGSSPARGIRAPSTRIGITRTLRVDAPPPILVGDREPLITDQRQQNVAGPDRPGDHLDEVVAQLDRVDVFEDLSVAEVLCKSIEQPAGRVGGLVPPVADEDSSRWSCGGYSHRPHLDTCRPRPSNRGRMRPKPRAVARSR